MEAKKEGKDIPSTETNKIILSSNVSLYNAENTPKRSPNTKANIMEESAKTKVFLKAEDITVVTEIPLRTKDSRK